LSGHASLRRTGTAAQQNNRLPAGTAPGKKCWLTDYTISIPLALLEKMRGHQYAEVHILILLSDNQIF